MIQISASLVARITGVSHHHPAGKNFLTLSEKMFAQAFLNLNLPSGAI
jgi:hypothetical protein